MNIQNIQRKQEILDSLSRDRTVEMLVKKISKGTFSNTQDLVQDIYLSLLEKEPEKIISLNDQHALNFFIVRMIRNNLFSKTSPYYKRYNAWDINREGFNTDYACDDE